MILRLSRITRELLNVNILLREFPVLDRSESADPVICECFQVRKSRILDAIRIGGAETVEEVTRQTCAGGGCGGCRCRIQRLLAGLPVQCGPCGLCPDCGCIRKLCYCAAA